MMTGTTKMQSRALVLMVLVGLGTGSASRSHLITGESRPEKCRFTGYFPFLDSIEDCYLEGGATTSKISVQVQEKPGLGEKVSISYSTPIGYRVVGHGYRNHGNPDITCPRCFAYLPVIFNVVPEECGDGTCVFRVTRMRPSSIDSHYLHLWVEWQLEGGDLRRYAEAPPILIVGDIERPGGNNLEPTARIRVAPGKDPNTLIFDGSGSTDPEGQVLSYEWAFSDSPSTAEPLTEKVVEHTFPFPGTFAATLIVQDPHGAADDTAQVVSVGGAQPTETKLRSPSFWEERFLTVLKDDVIFPDFRVFDKLALNPGFGTAELVEIQGVDSSRFTLLLTKGLKELAHDKGQSVVRFDGAIPDSDGDGITDDRDGCRWSADCDFDGQLDGSDNCPLDANSDQKDTDDDGVGDVCDRCPTLDDFQTGADWTILGTEILEACEAIAAGRDFHVGAGGDVVLKAPTVGLVHGFGVLHDGELVIDNPPP